MLLAVFKDKKPPCAPKADARQFRGCERLPPIMTIHQALPPREMNYLANQY